jgi:hypothetical protein
MAIERLQNNEPPLVVGKYAKLDVHINGILHSLGSLKKNWNAYFGEAYRQGLTEEQAKTYLLERIPKTTFYRYLPDEYKDKRKQNRKAPVLDKFGPEMEPKSKDTGKEFNTQGMGVIITNDVEVSGDKEEDMMTLSAALNKIQTLEHTIRELEQELAYYKKMPSNDALIGRIDILKHENAAIRKELEALKQASTPDLAIATQQNEWLLEK